MTALLLQKGTQMRSLKYVLEKTTDERISRGMQRLLLCDQKRKVDFLYYLAEADKRKLYAKEGYSSLFNWLTGKYRLSEPTALKRIQVARLAHKFPFLYRDIRQGKYTLTVLSRISKFVKGYNAHLVFAIAENKSVREVEAALVEMFPKEKVEEALRKSVSPLGLERHSVQFTADTGFIQDLQEARALLSHRFPKGKLNEVLGLALKTLLHDLKKSPRVRRQDKQPLATEVQRAKVFFHDAAIRPTPAREVAITSTRNENAVIQHSLSCFATKLVDRTRNEKESFVVGAQKENVSAVPPNFISPQESVLATKETLPATERPSRYIPREIRFQVWSRDKGKCQYPRPDGGICGETHFLELDHLHPFALGGANTESNLRLSCWAHNALRAERQFGKHRAQQHKAKTGF
jgi:5-methylcytosine-specific restriction endonuclease McrA